MAKVNGSKEQWPRAKDHFKAHFIIAGNLILNQGFAVYTYLSQPSEDGF